MLNEIALVGYIAGHVSVKCDAGKLQARFTLETHNFQIRQRFMRDEIERHKIVCLGRFATILSQLNPADGTILSLRGRIKTIAVPCETCGLCETSEIWVERLEDTLKAGAVENTAPTPKRIL